MNFAQRTLTAASILTVVLGAMLAASCAPRPSAGDVYVQDPMPSRDDFVLGGVSAFMERRCGALDCHGQVGRPLRIYSQYGLRKQSLDGGRDPGETTEEERVENYKAVIGLEPEDIAFAVSQEGRFVDFQLLKKPLGIENGGVRHKGGPVLVASDKDPGWQCLLGWIAGRLDSKDCADAAF